MRTVSRTLAGLLTLALVCAPMNAQEKTPDKISILREWKGGHCGVEKPAQLIIRDAKAWADLWAKIHRNVEPKPALPEVDFEKQTVVAVFAGTKPTGGYSIRIRDIRHDAKADKLLVFVEETSPPPGSITIQVLTQPYHVVVIPKTDKEIEFRR
jgi:hypothetical protein